MQRIGKKRRRHPVGFHRERHGGGLQGQADILKAKLFQKRRVAPGALHHGLRARVPVFFQKPLFKTSGVDADADGYVSGPAGSGHGLHLLLAADVAGVDPYFVYAPRGALQGEAVVKMDIRHKGNVHALLDGGYGHRRGHIRHRQAHDVAARGPQGPDLGNGGFHVPGLCVAHGLHRHRRAATDGKAARAYFSRCVSLIHYPVTILKISLNMTMAIRPSSITMPAAWI